MARVASRYGQLTNADVAPAKMYSACCRNSRERIEHIHRESLKALATSDVRRVMDTGGMYAVGGGPDEFEVVLKKDFEYQGRVMEEIGLKVH